MRKKVFVFFILAVCSFRFFSQVSFDLSFGPQYGYLFHKSYNTFRASYNDYHKSELTDPLGALTHNLGGSVLLRCYLNEKISLHVGYQQMRSRTSSRFTTGAGRVFLHRYGTPIYGGVGFSGKRRNSFELSAMFANLEMATYYRYPDKSISYGGEKLLNGTFTTFQAMLSAAYTLRFKKGTSPWSLRAEFQFPLAPPDIIFEYTDSHWARDLSITPVYMSSIPTDYALFLKDPINYPVDNTMYVSNRIKYLSVSVQYTIKLKRKNTSNS